MNFRFDHTQKYADRMNELEVKMSKAREDGNRILLNDLNVESDKLLLEWRKFIKKSSTEIINPQLKKRQRALSCNNDDHDLLKSLGGGVAQKGFEYLLSLERENHLIKVEDEVPTIQDVKKEEDDDIFK